MTVAPTAILNEQLILQIFEESLGYWCEFKSRIQKHTQNGKRLKHADGTEVTELARFIHRELSNHFKQQEQKVKSVSSGGQFIQYMQAQYAIVALIDDQLLQPGKEIWNGETKEQDKWFGFLLEKTLFQTRIAGDKLIARIEELVNKDSSADQVSSQVKQLAYIYLTIIWQGFKGKMYREQDTKRLNEIKAALIEISEYSPLKIKDNNNPLLEQPYPKYNLQNKDKNSKKENDNSRLAPISRWHRVVLFAALFYVLASTGTWYSLTYQLNNLLDTFTEEQSKQSHGQKPPPNGARQPGGKR